MSLHLQLTTVLGRACSMLVLRSKPQAAGSPQSLSFIKEFCDSPRFPSYKTENVTAASQVSGVL